MNRRSRETTTLSPAAAATTSKPKPQLPPTVEATRKPKKSYSLEFRRPNAAAKLPKSRSVDLDNGEKTKVKTTTTRNKILKIFSSEVNVKKIVAQSSSVTLVEEPEISPVEVAGVTTTLSPDIFVGLAVRDTHPPRTWRSNSGVVPGTNTATQERRAFSDTTNSIGGVFGPSVESLREWHASNVADKVATTPNNTPPVAPQTSTSAEEEIDAFFAEIEDEAATAFSFKPALALDFDRNDEIILSDDDDQDGLVVNSSRIPEVTMEDLDDAIVADVSEPAMLPVNTEIYDDELVFDDDVDEEEKVAIPAVVPEQIEVNTAESSRKPTLITPEAFASLEQGVALPVKLELDDVEEIVLSDDDNEEVALKMQGAAIVLQEAFQESEDVHEFTVEQQPPRTPTLITPEAFLSKFQVSEPTTTMQPAKLELEADDEIVLDDGDEPLEMPQPRKPTLITPEAFLSKFQESQTKITTLQPVKLEIDATDEIIFDDEEEPPLEQSAPPKPTLITPETFLSNFQDSETNEPLKLDLDATEDFVLSEEEPPAAWNKLGPKSRKPTLIKPEDFLSTFAYMPAKPAKLALDAVDEIILTDDEGNTTSEATQVHKDSIVQAPTRELIEAMDDDFEFDPRGLNDVTLSLRLGNNNNHARHADASFDSLSDISSVAAANSSHILSPSHSQYTYESEKDDSFTFDDIEFDGELRLRSDTSSVEFLRRGDSNESFLDGLDVMPNQVLRVKGGNGLGPVAGLVTTPVGGRGEYGDGSELDGFDDFEDSRDVVDVTPVAALPPPPPSPPVQQQQSKGVKGFVQSLKKQISAPAVQKRGGAFSPTPKKALGEDLFKRNSKRFADAAVINKPQAQAVAAAASVKEERKPHSYLQSTFASRKRAQLATAPPPTKKKPKQKKPTLIRNLGGSSSVKVVGDMRYNPVLKKWEGNEEILKAFDAAPPKPTLITPTNIPNVINGMVFDPVQMKWIGNDEDDDVFKDIDASFVEEKSTVVDTEFIIGNELRREFAASEDAHGGFMKTWYARGVRNARVESRETVNRQMLHDIRLISLAYQF